MRNMRTARNTRSTRGARKEKTPVRPVLFVFLYRYFEWRKSTMADAVAPSLKKTFALDPAILGPNSSATVELGGTTALDVVLAVASNKPFPTRPDGIIDLAH